MKYPALVLLIVASLAGVAQDSPTKNAPTVKPASKPPSLDAQVAFWKARAILAETRLSIMQATNDYEQSKVGISGSCGYDYSAFVHPNNTIECVLKPIPPTVALKKDAK